MRLLLDEDTQARSLVGMLRTADHDVTTVVEHGLAGQDDSTVLAHAHGDCRALLTRNARDFRELHRSGAQHSGILVIFRSRDVRKNMAYADIVRAIGSIEEAGLDLAGQFIALNAWK